MDNYKNMIKDNNINFLFNLSDDELSELFNSDESLFSIVERSPLSLDLIKAKPILFKYVTNELMIDSFIKSNVNYINLYKTYGDQYKNIKRATKYYFADIILKTIGNKRIVTPDYGKELYSIDKKYLGVILNPSDEIVSDFFKAKGIEVDSDNKPILISIINSQNAICNSLNVSVDEYYDSMINGNMDFVNTITSNKNLLYSLINNNSGIISLFIELGYKPTKEDYDVFIKTPDKLYSLLADTKLSIEDYDYLISLDKNVLYFSVMNLNQNHLMALYEFDSEFLFDIYKNRYNDIVIDNNHYSIKVSFYDKIVFLDKLISVDNRFIQFIGAPNYINEIINDREFREQYLGNIIHNAVVHGPDVLLDLIRTSKIDFSQIYNYMPDEECIRLYEYNPEYLKYFISSSISDKEYSKTAGLINNLINKYGESIFEYLMKYDNQGFISQEAAIPDLKGKYYKYYGYEREPDELYELLNNYNEETKEEFKSKFNHSSSDYIFMGELIKKDSSFINCYKGNNLDFYLDALDVDFNEVFSYLLSSYNSDNYDLDSPMSVINNDSNFYLKAVGLDPRFIAFYTGKDENVYKEALNKNNTIMSELLSSDLLKEEKMDSFKQYINENPHLIDIIIKNDINILKYYSGPSTQTINEFINNNLDLVIQGLLSNDFDKHLEWVANESIVTKLLEIDIELALDILHINKNTIFSDEFYKKAIKIDSRFIYYYKGDNEEILNSFCDDYIDEFIKDLSIDKDAQQLFFNNPIIATRVLEYDNNYIKMYHGKMLPIIDKIFEDNPELVAKSDYLTSREDYEWFYDERLLIKMLHYNINLLDKCKDVDNIIYILSELYMEDDKYKSAIERYLKNKPYIYVTDEKLYDFYVLLFNKSSNKMPEDILEFTLFMMLDKGESISDEAIKNKITVINSPKLAQVLVDRDYHYILYCSDYIIDQVKLPDSFDKSIPVTVINKYSGDKVKLLDNYNTIREKFELFNIDPKVFFQYALNFDIKWLDNILAIDNSTIQSIVNSNAFNKIYKINGNASDAKKALSINNFIKNINRYPRIVELILSKELSDEEYQTINNLFEINNTLPNINNINSINDIFNVYNQYLNGIQNDIDDLTELEIKDNICNLLFNRSYKNVCLLLSRYETLSLKRIKYDHKNNKEINDLFNILILLNEMMIDITRCNDTNALKSMLNNIINVRDESVITSYMNVYEEIINQYYELDMIETLTKLDNISNKDMFIDKESTDALGVEVIDLSESDYVLLAHVLSGRETIEEIVNGKSSYEHNLICLSAISYRNKYLYSLSEDDDIIFGYESIPKSSLIALSDTNMSSNSGMERGSTDTSGLRYKQSSVLQASGAPYGCNSEILCYRAGLKPTCIIVEGTPKPREIEIAKQYNLKIVKTQERRKPIIEPIHIEYDEFKQEKIDDNSIQEKIRLLSEYKDKLLMKQANPRKIAIFTDAHALFEPTLAVLDDAKKEGITEIYSLGDNIGTGPSPKEVMDLLEEYGVESLMGNHEMYLYNIDDLKEHLVNTGAYDHTLVNSSWTRSKLTDEQLSRISVTPHMKELVLGGKKILLAHYTKDYNSEADIYDSSEYDDIFQGHEHFEGNNDNIHTLRGVAVGDTSGIKEAEYVILTEKPEGGYDIEVKKVYFDKKQLEYEIRKSQLKELDESEYNKLLDWTRGGR